MDIGVLRVKEANSNVSRIVDVHKNPTETEYSRSLIKYTAIFFFDNN